MTDDDHHDLDHDLNPMPERSYTAMTRRCLKCEKAFESEWSGERVCSLCKRQNIWRSGTTFTPDYEVHRRR